MTEFIEPFNFQKIFVEYFLGGTELAFTALIIIFSILAAKVQMSNRLFLTILILLSLLFGAFIGEGMFIIILLVLGLVTWKAISKLWT
jgi:hypothetical protein